MSNKMNFSQGFIQVCRAACAGARKATKDIQDNEERKKAISEYLFKSQARDYMIRAFDFFGANEAICNRFLNGYAQDHGEEDFPSLLIALGTV